MSDRDALRNLENELWTIHNLLKVKITNAIDIAAGGNIADAHASADDAFADANGQTGWALTNLEKGLADGWVPF